jgi:hypothetical protein
MAGGVALFLLFVIIVIAIVIGIVSYLGGGFLWWHRTGSEDDEVSGREPG